MKYRVFSTSNSWLEGSAVQQFERTASLPGVENAVAMPDLHVSKGSAVGSAILTRGIIYPHLIGNDYGCGYSMFITTISAFKCNVTKLAEKMVGLDGEWQEDASSFLASTGLIAASSKGLGTVGGGNHFAELQKVSAITNEKELSDFGIDPNYIVLLVHSGSRSVGESLWQKFASKCGSKGFVVGSHDYNAYMSEQSETIKWASANRSLIAKRLLDAFGSQGRCISDVPHNFIESIDDGFVHRKGAAPTNRGISPLPGSRGTLTYLLKSNDNDLGLFSLPHGAGRKISRSGMHGRTGETKRNLKVNPFGGIVVCGDDILLEEEHSSAYKSVDQVLFDLKAHNLATDIAALQPILTYKSAEHLTPIDRRPKSEKEQGWRKERHKLARKQR